MQILPKMTPVLALRQFCRRGGVWEENLQARSARLKDAVPADTGDTAASPRHGSAHMLNGALR